MVDLDAPLFLPIYAPRLASFPIPSSGSLDEPLVCFKVNAKWVGHIIGVFDALDQADAWQGDAEQVEDARGEVRKIIASMESCDQVITDIRINNCIIEALIGGEWVAKVDITDCVDSRIEIGADDEFRDRPWDEPTDADIPPSVAELDCVWGGCLALVSYIFSTTSTVLDIFEAGANAAEAAGDFVTTVPGFSFLPPANAFNTMALAGSITVAVARLALIDEVREMLACELFCRIRSAGDPYTLTEEIYDGWTEWIEDQTLVFPPEVFTIGLGFIASVINDIVGHRYAYVRYSLGLNNCDNDWEVLCGDCVEPTWCYKFDFTIDEQGWSAYDIGSTFGATHSAGIGWKPIDNASNGRNNRAAAIKIDISSTVLTRISALIDFTKGAWTTPPVEDAYVFEEFNPREFVLQTPQTSTMTGDNQVIEWTGSKAVDQNIGVTIRSSRTTITATGDCTIKSVTFYGTGENPFGEDNC